MEGPGSRHGSPDQGQDEHDEKGSVDAADDANGERQAKENFSGIATKSRARKDAPSASATRRN